MNERNVLLVTVMLAGCMLISRCHHPTPSAAAVEITSGAVAEADRTVMQDLVGAFHQTGTAVQHPDLDALMRFYAKATTTTA